MTDETLAVRSDENPIIRDEELGRWRISTGRPAPQAHTRLVFLDSRKQLHSPDQPITLGEAVWGSLRRLYEVDMSEHEAELTSRLPCREQGLYFEVGLSFTWRVHDARRVVQQGLRDVRLVYSRHIETMVRRHSERFELKRRVEAERTIQDELAEPLVLDEGIVILRCVVSLTLDEEAEQTLAGQYRAVLASESRINDTKLNHTETEEAFVNQQLVGSQRGLHEEARLRREIELDDLRRARELAEAAHQRQLEDERMDQKFKRMERYQELLERGNISFILTMFLDEHPRDVDQLINLLVSERHNNADHSRALLSTLVGAGLINAAELDGTRRQLLANLHRDLGVDPLTGAHTPALATPRVDTLNEADDSRTAVPDTDEEGDVDDDTD